MKITGVLLIGMIIFLQGCGIGEDSHATLTTQLTPIQTISYGPTQTPIPLTFDLSMLSACSWTGSEINHPSAILFALGGGIEDSKYIFIVNEDGSGFECVVGDQSYSDFFYSPTWSGDGTMYAYLAGSFSSFEIRVRTNLFSEYVLVHSEDKWYDRVELSPNGRYIAFSFGYFYRPDQPNLPSPVCYQEVNLSSLESVEPTCVEPAKVNTSPSWSPDGRRIIFSGGGSIYTLGGEPTDLYIWDLNGQTVSQFTDTPQWELAPRWSPDGSKLAYVLLTRENSSDLGKYELRIVNADGSEPITIAESSDMIDYDWSPDGRKIVFTQTSPIMNEWCDAAGCLPYTILKIINLDTGTVTNLTDGTFWVGDPAWKP